MPRPKKSKQQDTLPSDSEPVKAARIGMKATVLAAVIAVSGTVFAILYKGCDGKKDTSAPSQTTIAINSFNQFSEKAGKSADFRESHSGETVEWGGFVYDVVKVPDTTTTILALVPTRNLDNWDGTGVWCMFREKWEKTLFVLTPGQEVVVTGRYGTDWETMDVAILELAPTGRSAPTSVLDSIGILTECQLKTVKPMSN